MTPEERELKALQEKRERAELKKLRLIEHGSKIVMSMKQDEGIAWTLTNICIMTGIDSLNAVPVLAKLVNDGFIAERMDGGSLYFMLPSGTQHAEGLEKNSAHDTGASIREHKEEALSGTILVTSKKTGGKVTRRSPMKKAVLLSGSGKGHYRSPQDLPDFNSVEALSAILDFCKEHGLTKAEFKRLSDKKLIRVCPKHGEMGRFHKGEKWCIKCKKEYRKAKK